MMSAFGALQAPATKKFFYFSNFPVSRKYSNWQIFKGFRCLGPAQLAPWRMFWQNCLGVVGVINRLRLEREFAQDANQQLGTIVSGLNFPHVHSDQSLDLALERMGANQLDVLPVVNRANVHELEGIVTLGDVLNSYGVSPPDRD
jgi:hypothetical protein